ncbi:hypothetical protein GPY37_11580 [Photorhabdus kayaii]|nr:hypothetical protein [Photorhabdus kayaii]
MHKLSFNYAIYPRISRCIVTAREQIPGSVANYMTGVNRCSQQRGNLKDNGYIAFLLAKADVSLYA